MNPWHMFYEIGALTGHPEPADFANFMTSPECAHTEWYADGEPCPAPCEKPHRRCKACHCPADSCSATTSHA